MSLWVMPLYVLLPSNPWIDLFSCLLSLSFSFVFCAGALLTIGGFTTGGCDFVDNSGAGSTTGGGWGTVLAGSLGAGTELVGVSYDCGFGRRLESAHG